jgi:hypothetical protein
MNLLKGITLMTLVSLSMMITEFYGFNKYGTFIIIVGFSIQILILISLFIFTLIYSRKVKNQIQNSVKIPRYHIEDKHIKGGTEIFQKSLFSTNPNKSSIFKIYLEIDDFNKDKPPNLEIFMKNEEQKVDIFKKILNAQVKIIDKLFIFSGDVVVGYDQKINFKFINDTYIKKFSIGELYIP